MEELDEYGNAVGDGESALDEFDEEEKDEEFEE